MTPPGIVAVGRHVYKIVWHDSSFLQDGKEVLGATRFEEAELHVSTGQSPTMVKDTLMHECLHAIGYEVDALGFQNLVHDNFNLEEHIVTVLTPRLLDFLADNPPLIKWLTS